MGDHAQVFHLVKVVLDLWVQGNGAFPGGMYHGMDVVMELDLVFARQSGNSLIKSSVELMDLAASEAVAGLVAATVVETGSGHWGFVPGCVVVMAQFIFMTASFSLEGRPRMAGPGVSVTYQYEFTLWGQAPRWSGCQVMGATECTI